MNDSLSASKIETTGADAPHYGFVWHTLLFLVRKAG